MDVVSAFLNDDVKSEIYMDRPEGYVAYEKKGQCIVCHFKKALYGIREASKAWNELFTAWLVNYGFIQSLVDHGVFTLNHRILLYIIALYVDNSIFVGKQGDFIMICKAALSNDFEIEDLGHASWLLGAELKETEANAYFDLVISSMSQTSWMSSICPPPYM